MRKTYQTITETQRTENNGDVLNYDCYIKIAFDKIMNF